MAMIIEISEEYNLGLFDSDTGISCQAEKVVDITDDCPKANQDDRAILLFTRAKRGRIVQISHPSKGETYGGTLIHFFVDELENEMNTAPRDDTFGSRAKRLGLSKTELTDLIKKHAPN